MPIVYQKWITRADLRTNPDKLYVFGDNLQRRGMGGQAKAMRGEPNAVGVATKHKPTLEPDAFFRDSDKERLQGIVANDLQPLIEHLRNGGTVVWPKDGIGTGLSRLPQYAPKLWQQIENARHQLEQIGED